VLFACIERLFVKRFTLCYQTDVCLSCLSVMLVYFGQKVEWIKMKLDMQVGLGPGHILLGGDPAPPPPKGAQPVPVFGPCLSWMGEDATC